jgi:two-component sensor histidine kinase
MGALMRAHDWRASPLGDPAHWPDTLKSATATCLASRFPMVIWWGPDLIMLYNDAWQPILGEVKHPAGLGRPGAASWPETWPIVRQQFENALKGVGSWAEDLLLASDRQGFLEECYFTYSHSPLKDARGLVVGVQSTVIETTARVLSERRLRALRALSRATVKAATKARTVDETCQDLVDIVCSDKLDIPFALQYLVDERGESRLVASAGVDPGIFPQSPTPSQPSPFDISCVLRDREPRIIDATTIPSLPGGPWPEPTTQLVALPIIRGAQDGDPIGVLLTGISPRLRLDTPYMDFLRLAAAQLAASLTALRHIEQEQRSLRDKETLIAELEWRAEELRVSREQLAADLEVATRLYDVGARCVRAGHEVDQCLEAILDTAIFITRADKGNIQLFDAGANALVIKAQRGFSQPFLDFFRHVRAGSAACGSALAAAERLVVEDVGESARFAGTEALEVLRAAGVRAVQSTPLVGSTGRVLGMVSTHFSSPKRPSEPELRRLDLLVRQAGDYLERLEAEERQRLLAREVDHRAKNLLAVVQSILNLTQAADAGDFAGKIGGRIMALGRAHTLMADSHWEGGDIARLVAEELSPFSTSNGAVSAQGPPVVLRPSASQSVALVLHELATNAAKYGALSRSSGRLSVTWRVSEQGLDLDWIESGGPTIEAPPVAHGFGTSMLRAGIEQQLGGRVRLEWHRDGLRVGLWLPATQFAGLASRVPPPLPVPVFGDQIGPATTAPVRLEGRRILVVEDESLVAMMIADSLEEIGCSVVGPIARLGEGLALAEESELDAAVLDRNLAGASSDPIARELHARGIPFVIVSGYADLARPREMAAAPYLTKPFQPEALIAILADLIADERVPAPARG